MRSLVCWALLWAGCRAGEKREEQSETASPPDGLAVHSEASLAPEAQGDWVRLPPGPFRMGSALGEPCRDADETPVSVQLSHPFEMLRLEVSQRDFEQALGYNPSFREDCSTCPVDSVSRHEAARYCNVLSEGAGLSSCYECEGKGRQLRCERTGDPTRCTGYRLPTEAEWEYAARAGARTATPEGNVLACMARDEAADRVAWYKANSNGESHPGGTLSPNRWGLYDMEGNVYEWTGDWYQQDRTGGGDPSGPKQGTHGVLRGGSWYHNAHHARLAKRLALPPERGTTYTGFRCVRRLGAEE